MSDTEKHFPKRPKLSNPLPNQNKELCLQFQRGSCIYGHRCCFTHDENKKARVRCGEKTKVCWRFMNGEKCLYGDNCHFIHFRSQSSVVLPWKTKLCNSWMHTASCKYGPTCCFAHGVSELQNQGLGDGQDYADGEAFKSADKNMEGKGLKAKWKSNEWISQVYADWISDMPLVSHTI